LDKVDLIDNCNPELSMVHYKRVAERYRGQVPMFAGIDWLGGSGTDSNTVLTLGAYLPFDPNMFTMFYYHQFVGAEADPKEQFRVICELIDEFGVQHVGVDYGGGHWPNDELIRRYGPERIHRYQYSGNVKYKIKFDPKLGIPRHLCHRTEIMSDIFNAIKRRDVFRFPRVEEFMEPFGQEYLNIFSEYRESMRMNIYKKTPGQTDDSFHSHLYCFWASMFYRKRPDVILPVRLIDMSTNTRPDVLDVDEEEEVIDYDE
jgi:hypothetical protein